MERDTRFDNQKDIFDAEKHGDKKICIVGAGGIGSTSAYFLAQMGFNNITVIDHDEVENHNIASQFFKQSQIGEYKVNALKDNIKEFTGVEIEAIDEMYQKEYTEDATITIMAVDNMETRKQIAETAKSEYTIDGRMKGEVFILYTFRQGYESDIYLHKSWFPDSEGAPVACTEKAVSFNTGAIGAMVAKICKDLTLGDKVTNYEHLVDLSNMSIK